MKFSRFSEILENQVSQLAPIPSSPSLDTVTCVHHTHPGHAELGQWRAGTVIEHPVPAAAVDQNRFRFVVARTVVMG